MHRKTQETCDKAVDSYLLTLKFVPDLFVTSKMLEKLDSSVFSDGDIFLHDIDSNIITFFSDDMGFGTTDLNNINLDDDNFDLIKKILNLLLMLDLWLGVIDITKAKYVKMR